MVDFDAIGRYWIKHVLRFSADKLSAAPGVIFGSIENLYPDETSSIAAAAVMWGKEFSKLVNNAVAVKYEDLRKNFRGQDLHDASPGFQKSPKKGEKGHRTGLQKEKAEVFKPTGMCIDFNKDRCQEPCPFGLSHHKIAYMQFARGNCSYGDACKFAHLETSNVSAKTAPIDGNPRPNNFAALQPSAIKKAKLKVDK
jgi:hypothetical protein